MSTRGNNPAKTVRGVIMQRLHSGDLTGYLIDKMLYEEGTRYEVLCLPAEYEPNRSYLTTGWQDPRTESGQLLWPERFDRKAIESLKNDLGEDAAGQLQQRPTSTEGGIFQRAWWGIPTHGEEGTVQPINRYRIEENTVVARWLLYDTAFKDKDSNDPSACSVWELLDDYRLRLRHQWNRRIVSAKLPDLIQADIEEWDTDGLLRDVVIEDKGSGITTVQTLSASAEEKYRDRIVGFPVNQSKEYRANLAAVWCYRSCVLLPYPESWNASWFTTLLDPDKGQLFLFPNALHDDLVDTFSMGILYLENYLKMGWQGRQQS
jgi:phage terminase large subunit-like protein